MSITRGSGHHLGTHRVRDDSPCLPQAAYKLDATLPLYDNEALVQVDVLQIDAASFHQLLSTYPYEPDLVAAVEGIVLERGKMVNPVTGSGGMLLGTVIERGKNFGHVDLPIGTKLATLVSLTATPLQINRVLRVDRSRERIYIDGHAILFSSTIAVPMPNDIPEGLALAAFDVCGAPAQALKCVQNGHKVLVIGLGKAGLSILSALRMRYGNDVQLLGVDRNAQIVGACRQNYHGEFVTVDAHNPLAVSEWVRSVLGGECVDVVINTTSVADTEMSAILSVKEGGTVLFFGMATSFAKTVLGAESVARDIKLLMGNGYAKDHANLMLSLLRTDPFLRVAFSHYCLPANEEVQNESHTP